MKYTGTQIEQYHLSNDNARVDLDESFESLATTTSDASEWTLPETEENNTLDNQEAPLSHRSRKFIVFEDCLDQLLQLCTICRRKCDIQKNVVGTMLVVSRLCDCGEAFTWESQSLTASMPTGNLVLSAAILFIGCSIKQSLIMF